jgi:hypothetical protein
MGQRGDHAPQRRQALVARQLVLQATGFSQVVEQHQLAGLGIQRAGGDRQAPTVFQETSWPSSSRGAKQRAMTWRHNSPSAAAKQLAGRRVGFAHQALAIDDDHTAGQQIQQVLQAVGQAFFSASSCMRWALTTASSPLSSVTRASSML